MFLVVKDVVDLTAQEYQWCRDTNFRNDGFMRGTLRVCRDAESRFNWFGYKVTEAHMVFLDESCNYLVGWALVFGRTKTETTAHFYTKRKFRRQGIGTQLMKSVKGSYPKVKIVPHDERAYGFFGKTYAKTQKQRDDLRIQYRSYNGE